MLSAKGRIISSIMTAGCETCNCLMDGFYHSSSIFTSLHAGDNMPIGGIVITVRPDDRQDTEVVLARFSELSVYGSDEKGNIIAMLKGNEPESIEEAIVAIEAIDTVLEVNLVYLNAEDSANMFPEEE